jgi:hypothetical protein
MSTSGKCYLACFAALATILLNGCSGGNSGAGFGVVSSINARFHTGTVIQNIPDTSGTITVNGASPGFNGILCETAGPNFRQPPAPITTALLGSSFIDYNVGTSPNPGQCLFGSLAFPHTYDMNFVSPLCGTNHPCKAARLQSQELFPPTTAMPVPRLRPLWIATIRPRTLHRHQSPSPHPEFPRRKECPN